MSLAIYDVNEVSVSMGGFPLDAGRAEGVFITVDGEDQFGQKVGSGGDVVRYRIHSPVLDVTVRLLSSSLGNDVLQALHILDLLAPNGAGVVPFSMLDLNGRDLLVTDKSWIVKSPNQTKGTEVVDLEWSIKALVSDGVGRFVGGNGQV